MNIRNVVPDDESELVDAGAVLKARKKTKRANYLGFTELAPPTVTKEISLLKIRDDKFGD